MHLSMQIKDKLFQPGCGDGGGCPLTFIPSTWSVGKRQTDLWVHDQPGLQSEFQDSQGYTEKPCLEKPKSNQLTKHTTKKQTQKLQQKSRQTYKNQQALQDKRDGSMKVLVFLAEDPGLIPSTCSQPWQLQFQMRGMGFMLSSDLHRQQTHMHCTPLAWMHKNCFPGHFTSVNVSFKFSSIFNYVKICVCVCVCVCTCTQLSAVPMEGKEGIG